MNRLPKAAPFLLALSAAVGPGLVGSGLVGSGLVGCGLVGPGLVGCATKRPADPRSERAAAFARVESWPEAAALWTEVYAASGGDDTEAGLNAADALLAAELPAAARVLLVDLTGRVPGDARVFERLGRAHEALGDPGAALGSYRTAVELDGTLPYAQARFGDLAFGLEGPEVGLPALERSVALDPGSARSRIRLGLRLLEAGRTDRAVAVLDGVLAGVHGTDEERLDAAAILGPHRAAVPWLEAVVRTRPDATEAQRLLGESLLAAGRIGPALRALEDAARSDPGDVEALVALSSALRIAGNEARARAVLEHAGALDLSPGERARIEALQHESSDGPEAPGAVDESGSEGADAATSPPSTPS